MMPVLCWDFLSSFCSVRERETACGLTEDETERVSERSLTPGEPRRVDHLRRAVDVAAPDPRR